MKTHIFLTVAIAALAITACITPKSGSQPLSASKVPPAVLASFQQQVPGITVHGWEIENGDYIPLYNKGGHEYNGLYSKTGVWLGTEEVITWKQMPQAGKDAFARSSIASGTNTETEQIRIVVGESLPLAATAWAATPSSREDSPQRSSSDKATSDSVSVRLANAHFAVRRIEALQ